MLTGEPTGLWLTLFSRFSFFQVYSTTWKFLFYHALQLEKIIVSRYMLEFWCDVGAFSAYGTSRRSHQLNRLWYRKSNQSSPKCFCETYHIEEHLSDTLYCLWLPADTDETSMKQVRLHFRLVLVKLGVEVQKIFDYASESLQYDSKSEN